MKSNTALLPLAFGLAAAAPRKYDECIIRDYNGHQVNDPDTAEAFQNFEAFGEDALNYAYAGNLPSGYNVVPGFVNLNAAAQSPSYLSTVEPAVYDPEICAALCEEIDGCRSFNIFFERVPLVVSRETLVPDEVSCPGLANSPSATLIRCSFFSDYINATEATNMGSYQGEFPLVFAGSNAYFKWEVPGVHGFDGPIDFANASISAPFGYLGMEEFDTGEYDPVKCANTCYDLYEVNYETGDITTQCIFFNPYVLFKNGANPKFHCAYYSHAFSKEQAINSGQFDGEDNVYTVGLSHGYYLQIQHFLPSNIYSSGEANPDSDTTPTLP